jgi:hypothetical protein
MLYIIRAIRLLDTARYFESPSLHYLKITGNSFCSHSPAHCNECLFTELEVWTRTRGFVYSLPDDAPERVGSVAWSKTVMQTQLGFAF